MSWAASARTMWGCCLAPNRANVPLLSVDIQRTIGWPWNEVEAAAGGGRDAWASGKSTASCGSAACQPF
jgi:hypothetical protein